MADPISEEHLREMISLLKRARTGESNLRISPDHDSETLNELVGELNVLLDQQQRAVEFVVNKDIFFGEILEKLPLEVVIFDNRFRFLYVNPIAVKDPVMREWLIGKTDFDYCRFRNAPIKIAEERQELYLKVINSRHHMEMQQDMEMPGGEIKHYLRTLSPVFDEKGALEMLVGYGINITDIKQHESQLRSQNEALEKANQELDQFVYRASHDMRAPLVSIMGLLNLSEMEPHSGPLGQYLQMIRQSVNKLDTFIREIVDYSKNTRQDVIIEEIDLSNTTQEVWNTLSELHPDQKVELDIDISGDKAFHSDSFRLSILLNNLLSNAIKYRNPATDSHRVMVRADVKPEEVVLEVEDNGKGIKREHLTQIFDMFFRATHDAFGSGIGLYIVREVLSKLNGTIEVESEYGQGATFRVKLPNLLHG